LRLKAFGYGVKIQSAPPIVSQRVQGNRIEYVRRITQPNEASEVLLDPPNANHTPPLVEWYENGATGLEQGFTLNTRPTRSPEVDVAEPLRLVVELSGELRARMSDSGNEIELLDECDEHVLRYGKLTAVDATGRALIARLETAAEGREIALVVVDDKAQYPLVVDPLVWRERAPLTGDDAAIERAGYSVAISGDTAVVGTCRGFETLGKAYVFVRDGVAWTEESKWKLQATLTGGPQSTTYFGCAVAINRNTAIVGDHVGSFDFSHFGL